MCTRSPSRFFPQRPYLSAKGRPWDPSFELEQESRWLNKRALARPAAAARSSGTRAGDCAVGTELHCSPGKSPVRAAGLCTGLYERYKKGREARGLPVPNWDRTSCRADFSTHAHEKGGSIRIRPSLDALPGSHGSYRETPSSRDLARGRGTLEGRVRQGGGVYEGVWACHARGDFHPLGPPYSACPGRHRHRVACRDMTSRSLLEMTVRSLESVPDCPKRKRHCEMPSKPHSEAPGPFDDCPAGQTRPAGVYEAPLLPRRMILSPGTQSESVAKFLRGGLRRARKGLLLCCLSNVARGSRGRPPSVLRLR
jgi:hypothetical protein